MTHMQHTCVFSAVHQLQICTCVCVCVCVCVQIFEPFVVAAGLVLGVIGWAGDMN